MTERNAENKIGRFSKDNPIVELSSKQVQIDKNVILPERPKEIKKERGE